MKLSADERRALVQCAELSPRQSQIVSLRFKDQLPFHIIAQRLGISASTVTSCLAQARKRLTTPRRLASTCKAMNIPIDQFWHERQVAYVRSLADEDHKRRYLRGISIVHGPEVADKVEREAA